MRILSRRVLTLLCLVLLLASTSAFGQGDWSATLNFDPYPSPYISDWESNPAIGQAFITNNSPGTASVQVFLTIVHDSRGQIASANSRRFDFPPGNSMSLTTRDLIDDQSVEYDHSIREIAVRTGRLPEGKYRICLRLEEQSGTVLLDNQCAEFTIVYPDPPYLVYPANGESVITNSPILQWTPVQVPVGFQVHYDLVMAELLEGQVPAQALAANYPQYRNTNLTTTSVQYPIDALALQKGKTYAWQVQVLDDHGYPPATNNGRSEIWIFLCDIDTVTPVDYRLLAGHVSDAATGQALGATTVVYRAVRRSISGSDTTWTAQDDSLVCESDQSGYFKFDKAINKSYYSLTATRSDYQTTHLVGQGHFQDGDIKTLNIRLPLAPPGSRLLAGVLRDFYSNEPVPNAQVTYHLVKANPIADSSGTGRIEYAEDSRKVLETITDAEGRFTFTQAADSSFFSLRASKSPSFLPAVDIGPDQRQVGDIDSYIFLIKPNAGSISGRLVTSVGGVSQPVPKAITRVVRTTSVTVATTFMHQTSQQVITLIDTAGPSAYSDANGNFKIQRLNQEKPTFVTDTVINVLFFRWKIHAVTTVQSYSYRIAVTDDRYQPYLSFDSVIVTAGETTESGQHELIPKSGSIVGIVRCDSLPVEGARVYLYSPTYRQAGTERKSAASAALGSTDTPEETGTNENPPVLASDSTWGNLAASRPSGEPLEWRQTDGSGNYAFPAVPINDPEQQTQRYTLWVETDGYNPTAEGVRVGAENEIDTVNFGLTRVGGIIFGQVTSPDGKSVSNVRVELQSADSLGASQPADPLWVATGGDGSYSLGNILPGLYRMAFTRSGYNSLTTDTFRIDYGDKFLRDEILSVAKGLIALEIKDKNDKGLSDVCVKSPEIPSLLGFTDKDGRILITDAVAGNVTLQLRRIGYADLDTTVVVSAEDTAKISATLQRSVGQVLVRVVEKGNTEKRLANMTVKFGKSNEKSGSSDPDLSKITDDAGEIVFDEAPAGQQTITVTPPTDSSYDQDYVISETQVQVLAGLNAQPIIIQMEPAARMAGVVRNKEGASPLDGVTVVIEGNTKIKAQSNTSGQFTLRNVPSGESTTLVLTKCGFRTARFLYDKRIAVGDKITGISIELEKSPMDSLFGFPIALDSVTTGNNGRNRVWGTLLSVPPTFGVKLRDEATPLTFADVEVDSLYRPVTDSIPLVQPEVEVDLFGFEGKMACAGGLCLQWVDSVKAGRISGSVTLKDPISKLFSETEFLDLTIPKKYAPSFWAGGVNRGLSRFGLTSTDKEVQVKIKAVQIGLDFTQSHVDTAGLHLFGTIRLGSTFEVGFEELLIGKDEVGEIALKAISIKTKPAIKIPFGVFTVVDSSLTWEATGFRASGAIVLNALENREFGFKDLRISPTGEFLSLAITADEKNGTIKVGGQSFQIEKIEFGTENFESKTLEHTKYFAFAGKLSVKAFDKPVGVSLRYTEKGLFTGKLEFNQSRTFGGIVTISLESIEIGYDSAKTEQFVGISGGVGFQAVVGLKLQASRLRFYFGGDVAFDEMALDFIAGPVQVKVSVAYANSVFEGKGWFEIKPLLSAGAEFRYGGSKDWWVRIISGTRIPIGPVEIVQASGGIGRKEDVWKFSIGGIVAPAKADKGIRLDLLVEVQMTPQGPIILGNANVEVASGTQIGRATIEINIPDRRVSGSIVFAMDFKALQANAQLDLCVKFDQYWYVYGRASIDVLKFFRNDGLIIVANNWTWQHDGQSRVMSGIYVELNSMFNVNANWYVVKWGVNLDRHAMVYIGWNGDFAGKIDMSGGAYAWIGFGPFDLIQARANMGFVAHLAYIEPEWTAGARGNFSLQGSIGWCNNASCWSICWKCFVRIFGRCFFALPTGAKACIGMNAEIDYATSRGMRWSISF